MTTSAQEGAAQPQYFLYHLRLNEPFKAPQNWTKEAEKAIGAHVQFFDSLGREGRLIFAGRTDMPLTDPMLFGIALVRAEDLDAAKRMMAPDPAVVFGIQRSEVLPYRLAVQHFENAPRAKVFPSIKMPSDTNSLEKLRAIDRDIWQPFVEAYVAGDADKYEALHSPDFIRATTEEVYGKAGSLQSSRRHFAWNRQNNRRCTIDFRFFERTVGQGLASERGIYRYTSILADGTALDYYGKFHVLHRLAEGRWQIATDYDSDEDGSIGKDDFEAGLPVGVFQK